MTDGDHFGGFVEGSEAHEIVVEDDVHDTVEAVLDTAMGSGGAGEKHGGERSGTEGASSGADDAPVALDLDHADGA